MSRSRFVESASAFQHHRSDRLDHVVDLLVGEPGIEREIDELPEPYPLGRRAHCARAWTVAPFRQQMQREETQDDLDARLSEPADHLVPRDPGVRLDQERVKPTRMLT